MPSLATCLGHPRIGVGRELKKALETFWAKKTSAADLERVARQLRHGHWSVMKAKGIDVIPSNDFSLYDHMLDMAVTVGAVPERYRGIADPLGRYFAMARGSQDRDAGIDVSALEMTKWFDTNYHYIVPELAIDQLFRLDAAKILAEIDEARAIGIEPRPVVPGPVTFLTLSKLEAGARQGATTLDLLDAVLPAYEELFGVLAARNVGWVQLDEPCLVLELDEQKRESYRRSFERLVACKRRPRLLVATYFGGLGENLPLVADSGVDGLHVDLTRAPGELDAVLARLHPRAILSAGVVDGRNVWRTDLDAAHGLLRRAVKALGRQRVLVAPSCSLLHVPVDSRG